MNFKRTLIGFAALITLIAGGCGFMSSTEDARALAEEFLDHRFTTGGVGNGEYYSELFWNYTRQEDWN